VPTGDWSYYARPAPGTPATDADFDAVRARQRERGLPETFEWIADLNPELRGVASGAGLVVEEYPLMVLAQPLDIPPPAGFAVRQLRADDDALAAALAVAQVGFSHAGTGIGYAGIAERNALASRLPAGRLDFKRRRLERGITVTVVAEDDSGPVAAGSHQPVEAVSELVGIATLPALRRRGLGAAITSALVTDARARGVELVFLSAGSPEVARIYARVGFVAIGTACAAEPDSGS
jgi:N-acetylglutamate synthase-like GNAT family acetyltransferase